MTGNVTTGKRCAIYTRKSTSEGLDQPFNSLEAQRLACENFVASQIGEGWSTLPTRYDDGGYSGASLVRPAVRRLIEDVESGLIDVVVVYKIDRLSRSLIDFATLMGRFETHRVSFVAVTQSFNTTSSMGRLTLNVLLSFAQFERELTSERLRDKFAASRTKGLWLSGPRPFGYRVVDRLLVVDESEAAVVRAIFSRYPKVGSARQLVAELTAKGVVGKTGKPIGLGAMQRLLRNRLYRGELPHGFGSVAGVHEAIVTERTWTSVQKAISESGRRRAALTKAPVPGALKGLIFDPTGHAFVHTFVYSRGRLYRYYVLRRGPKYGPGSNSLGRFRAAELERCVTSAIDTLLPAVTTPRSDPEISGLVHHLVGRIEIGPDDMMIMLTTGAEIRTAADGRIGGG